MIFVQIRRENVCQIRSCCDNILPRRTPAPGRVRPGGCSQGIDGGKWKTRLISLLTSQTFNIVIVIVAGNYWCLLFEALLNASCGTDIWWHFVGRSSRRGCGRAGSWEEISGQTAGGAHREEDLSAGQSCCDGFRWTHGRCSDPDQPRSSGVSEPQVECGGSSDTRVHHEVRKTQGCVMGTSFKTWFLSMILRYRRRQGIIYNF